MIDWVQFMKGKVFISDLGANQEVVVEGQLTSLGRYAVWSPVSNSTGHQVVAVGDNLQELCESYNVDQDRICSLIKEQ